MADWMPWLLAHSGEAHEGFPGPRDLHELLHTWSDDVFSWLFLALTAVLYAVGAYRLRSTHALTRRHLLAYWLGWITLFFALVSPIHPWGNVLFSVHMTQHEILMLVSAPLLVLSRPVVVSLMGLPRPIASRAGRLMNFSALRGMRHVLEIPLAAFVFHAVALWSWHIPVLFEAAIEHEDVHFLQHASFFLSALVFWWAILSSRRGPSAYGAGILFLFSTAVHSSLLGALITFAGSLWYPSYAKTTAFWHLTPLQDQQLGGLIMWIPAGLVYVLAALIMMVGWLKESERVAFVLPQADQPA